MRSNFVINYNLWICFVFVFSEFYLFLVPIRRWGRRNIFDWWTLPNSNMMKMVKHEHWTWWMRCQSCSVVNICCEDYRRVRFVLDDDDYTYSNLFYSCSVYFRPSSFKRKCDRNDARPIDITAIKNICYFMQFKKLRNGVCCEPSQYAYASVMNTSICFSSQFLNE